MYRFVVAVLLCLGFATPGHSQTIGYAEATDMLASACGKDIETLCKGVNLGNGRIKACMQRNNARVSRTCRETAAKAFALIEKRAAARVAVLKLCDADAQRLCGGVQRGDGQILECMLLAQKAVTPRCNQAISDAGYR